MDTIVAQLLSARSWIYLESKVFHYQRTILKKKYWKIVCECYQRLVKKCESNLEVVIRRQSGKQK
jgi:hypothetical protein